MGHASWPGFYRRSATGLAARGSGRRCPAPNTAPQGAGLLVGHASWPGFYRRGTTGATARRTGVVPCGLHSIDRHSTAGLMARNKGQRELDFTLAFYVAKITGPRWNIPHTGRDCPASAESWKSRLFIIREVVCVANHAAQSHHRNILQPSSILLPLFFLCIVPEHRERNVWKVACRHFFP